MIDTRSLNKPVNPAGFTDVIFLKYPYNGDTSTGIIRICSTINEEESIEFKSIEYSDQNIKSYVEKNPSILDNIGILRTELTD